MSQFWTIFVRDHHPMYLENEKNMEPNQMAHVFFICILYCMTYVIRNPI